MRQWHVLGLAARTVHMPVLRTLSESALGGHA
jgi:hypothetical protein